LYYHPPPASHEDLHHQMYGDGSGSYAPSPSMQSQDLAAAAAHKQDNHEFIFYSVC
jgi:hypothetical protein